ncbi:hypothetical protein DM860_017564 [Cuscuta australis]|uniref:ATP-dependent DNA helicase n=1 Tax=Cuscuta australis TaxID=267555 RepID=A0A328DUB1_9ASTE|nr:hypothetical protein DM860_017564 [Cuscuta australis]
MTRNPLGKKIVFGGDFRQILPVIPKGTRQDTVNATINLSYLWEHFTVLRLTENMRLQSMVQAENYNSLVEFAEWIDNIGDGNVGDEKDGCAKIVLPNDIILKYFNDPIEVIVQSTYLDFNIIANDPSYLQHRTIIAPTLDVIDAVNDYMTSKNVKEESKTYLSSDNICKSDSNVDVLSDLHVSSWGRSGNHQLRAVRQKCNSRAGVNRVVENVYRFLQD